MTRRSKPRIPLHGCVWAVPISVALWCVILLAVGVWRV
jgi:hypothetical protein